MKTARLFPRLSTLSTLCLFLSILAGGCNAPPDDDELKSPDELVQAIQSCANTEMGKDQLLTTLRICRDPATATAMRLSLEACTAERSTLQAQVSMLSSDLGAAKGQVATLTTENTALKAQVVQLSAQLAAIQEQACVSRMAAPLSGWSCGVGNSDPCVGPLAINGKACTVTCDIGGGNNYRMRMPDTAVGAGDTRFIAKSDVDPTLNIVCTR